MNGGSIAQVKWCTEEVVLYRYVVKTRKPLYGGYLPSALLCWFLNITVIKPVWSPPLWLRPGMALFLSRMKDYLGDRRLIWLPERDWTQWRVLSQVGVYCKIRQLQSLWLFPCSLPFCRAFKHHVSCFHHHSEVDMSTVSTNHLLSKRLQ